MSDLLPTASIGYAVEFNDNVVGSGYADRSDGLRLSDNESPSVIKKSYKKYFFNLIIKYY